MKKDKEEKENIEDAEPSNDSGKEEETVNEDDEVVKLSEQVSLLKDSLLRKTAELENLRKRLEKEKEEALKYANKNFARDLLTVLDNFERINAGLPAIEEKIKTDAALKAYFDGISLCEKELVSVFQRHGVSKIEVKSGDNFDHGCHQAMTEVESDSCPAGSVVQVFQSGYDYNGRLLRPAMVSVAKKSS